MTRYLTTAEVAEWLRVSEEWVREHAADLGAMRLGDSPRAPLRFDPQRVQAALEARTLQPSRRKRRRRPGPSHRGNGDINLLPIPEVV